MKTVSMALQRTLKMRHLRLLVALDEHRHLGRTAAHLHTSQPAISRTLGEIEAVISQTLFSRTPKGTVPTAAGEALIRHARQALQVLGNAEEELTLLSKGFTGRLRVGTNYSSAAYIVPNALLILKERAPKAQISIREASLESLLPELVAKRLDVIIARSDHRIAREGLRFKRLAEEPMTLVTGPDHPLARRRRIRWDDLRGFPWILPLADNPVRNALDAILLRNGLQRPDVLVECGSNLGNAVLLSRSHAISVLPLSVAKHYETLSLLHLLPLSLPEVFGPIGLITAAEDETTLLSLLERCVRQVCAGPKSASAIQSMLSP